MRDLRCLIVISALLCASAKAQIFTPNQGVLLLAGIHTLSHDCAAKFPAQADRFSSAFSALKERNKQVVPLSAWDRIAGNLNNGPDRPSTISVTSEQCTYFLSAAEDRSIDRQLEKQFLGARSAP